MKIDKALNILVKATSPSFSKSSVLRNKLLQSFPNAVFNETEQRLQGDLLVDYLKDAQGAIIGIEKIDKRIIRALPQLKIIAKYGVGLDNIDVEFARSQEITIGWTGGVNKRSVAEQTLAFMLGLCRNLFASSFDLKQGQWNKNGGTQLTGKTVGIIGCGHIGTEVLHLLKPFQCGLLICDILDKSEIAQHFGAKQVKLEELLSQADIISLHVPLTSQTQHLINTECLRKMKSSTFLINTSRGAVIEQNALKQALLNRRIAGAALDVFEEEPPEDMEFLSLSNLMVTPHIGGNAREAVEAMGETAIQHLRTFFYHKTR